MCQGETNNKQECVDVFFSVDETEVEVESLTKPNKWLGQSTFSHLRADVVGDHSRYSTIYIKAVLDCTTMCTQVVMFSLTSATISL